MGSEMCIRDRVGSARPVARRGAMKAPVADSRGDALLASTVLALICLLYTSDAADERSSVDLGGRRIIKKKKTCTNTTMG